MIDSSVYSPAAVCVGEFAANYTYTSSESHPACWTQLNPFEASHEQLPESGSSNYTDAAADYIAQKIYPFLLPAIKEMLLAATEEHVIERKRTRFNACDFLTLHLYRNNPNHSDRQGTELWDIPFAKRINATRPRPPLPLSLIWSEDEAAVVLQAAWRGYVARKDPEVQELRQYQKEMREEAYDINFKVEEFWSKHPVEQPTPLQQNTEEDEDQEH